MSEYDTTVLSPDGRYRWDGYGWLPVVAARAVGPTAVDLTTNLNIAPARAHRRATRQPPNLSKLIGAAIVVVMTVALGAVLVVARSERHHANAALASERQSLISTKAELNAARAQLSGGASELNKARADAKQATAALADAQAQLTAAQSGSAACQQFVADADKLLTLARKYIDTSDAAWSKIADGGNAQSLIDQVDALASQIDAANTVYKADRLSCLPGGGLPGSNA
jgi:septal ring factor EnvC (AmiA/AmiB activator)